MLALLDPRENDYPLRERKLPRNKRTGKKEACQQCFKRNTTPDQRIALLEDNPESEIL